MKSKDEIALLIKTIGQVSSLIDDFSELSKKAPNSPINKFKLNLINNVLSIANTFLVNGYLPLQEFTLFEEDSITSNSDVLIMLNQYIKGFEQFVEDNIQYDFSHDAHWIINKKCTDIYINISKLFGRKDGY